MAKVELIGTGGNSPYNPDAILSSLIGETSRVLVIYEKDGNLYMIQSDTSLHKALSDVTRTQHSIVKHLEE